MLLLDKLWRGFLYVIGFLIENPFITMGIFFFFVIRAFVRQVRQSRKLVKLSKEMKVNPSNENVKAFTDVLRKAPINNHPSTWTFLRETYFSVKDVEKVDYEIRLELCEVLKKKGTSGVYPPRQNHNQVKEEKIRQAGEDGEKQVAYALKWLDKKRFKVFGNLRLSDGGEPQEFDNIVVGDKAIFNIETKNYVGDLTIDEEGNWYRIVNGRKTGTENPIFQVKRHNTVLDNILESKLPIVDLVVWANVESVIEGASNSPVKVIKVDQLTYFIENFNEGKDLLKEEIDFAVKKIREHTQK